MTPCNAHAKLSVAQARRKLCDFTFSVCTPQRPHLQPLEILQRARGEALQRRGAHREGPLRAQRARAVQHEEQHF
jgi:hypothetical protein